MKLIEQQACFSWKSYSRYIFQLIFKNFFESKKTLTSIYLC